MPRPRFAKLASEKKHAILNAALEAFAIHGFDGASYNQIIERAGISKGAMYYYFDDKEDLYATVVRHELEDILAEFHDFPTASSPEEFWEVLDQFMAQALQFFNEHPLKVRLVRTVWKLRAEGIKSPLIQELFDMGRGFSVQLLQLGQSLGAVRDDLPFELLVNLVTAVDEAGDMWLADNLDVISEEEFRTWGMAFTDLLRRMLEPTLVKNGKKNH
ncbi:MAG: TetR/AcrR family transcriptional regulator [bacterium]